MGERGSKLLKPTISLHSATYEVEAAALVGSWTDRPPDGDDEGCYSLADYSFQADSTVTYFMYFEDLSEERREGKWKIAQAEGGAVVRITWTKVEARNGPDDAWAPRPWPQITSWGLSGLNSHLSKNASSAQN